MVSISAFFGFILFFSAFLLFNLFLFFCFRYFLWLFRFGKYLKSKNFHRIYKPTFFLIFHTDPKQVKQPIDNQKYPCLLCILTPF